MIFERIMEAALTKNVNLFTLETKSYYFFTTTSSLDIDIHKTNSSWITPAAQLIIEGNFEAAELLRQRGANVNPIACAFALRGDLQNAEKFLYPPFNASVDEIAFGFALGGHVELADKYRAPPYSASVHAVARGFALGKDRINAERYRKEYKASVNHIAPAFAMAGDVEEAARYHSEFNADACHIAYGLSLGGYLDEAKKYGNIKTNPFIEEGLIESGRKDLQDQLWSSGPLPRDMDEMQGYHLFSWFRTRVPEIRAHRIQYFKEEFHQFVTGYALTGQIDRAVKLLEINMADFVQRDNLRQGYNDLHMKNIPIAFALGGRFDLAEKYAEWFQHFSPFSPHKRDDLVKMTAVGFVMRGEDAGLKQLLSKNKIPLDGKNGLLNTLQSMHYEADLPRVKRIAQIADLLRQPEAVSGNNSSAPSRLINHLQNAQKLKDQNGSTATIEQDTQPAIPKRAYSFEI